MNKNFLQTKDWAKFQEAFGRKVFWIGDKLVVKFDLPLGKSWLYAARVDLPNGETEKQKNIKTNDFFVELSNIAKKENAIFAKIEPNINKISNFKFLISKPFENTQDKQITNHKSQITNCLQPQDELLLDISQSEKELLAQMHPKTRYNIRLAQKKGLKIEISQDPKDIAYFYNLALETSQRNRFKYHSRRYYEKMIETFGQESELKARVINAFYDNQVTASLILLIYKDTAYYLHGASSDKYHNLMSTFLLQWEAIKKAKKLDCKWYNFGGVVPLVSGENRNSKYETLNKSQIQNPKSKNENCDIENSMKTENCKLKIPTVHPWSGITRFKLGFAPLENESTQTLHYPDAYDIVYQPGMYWIYKLLKKIKN